MLLLYSHNHNDINNNSTYTYANTQVGTGRLKYTGETPLFRYEPFINFCLLFFDTRRETILKSLLYHTMLTTSFNGQNPTLCPNGRNSTVVSHGPTLKSHLPGWTPTSQHHCWTQILNIIVGPNFSPSWSDPNFNCLPLRQTTQQSGNIVQSQLPTLFFKIFKFSGPSLLGITSFTLQPHFLSGIYYDNYDCHILCA